MSIFKNLFMEHCPKCKKVLETKHSKPLQSIVIKSCPENHYHKEFHPALETYIETYKIS
ncbi:hypothetical protein [Neobacillus mesonae]|uniref:hypothetical protein n=1 Tax=Neobacillus mesonae TaxID=1193713 RepID=UPI000B010698|nr:hypothetical protein [Neobacillus mesonae]